MEAAILLPFRLVGGTSLSLQLGHRMSVDIDLFTDALYGSIDFGEIEKYLRQNFPYTDALKINIIGMGTSYYIGTDEQDAVKLDLYYTDSFIKNAREEERVRMATLDEIIAMKIDIVARIGRKKDFWDIHELLSHYTLQKMLSLHEERYPYTHDTNHILKNFTDFLSADNDFNPLCLRGKHWEIIKLELSEAVKTCS